MTNLVPEISQQAQTLGAQDRAHLAELLLDSIHQHSNQAIDGAWDAELLRRLDEVNRQYQGYVGLGSTKDFPTRAREWAHH